MSEPEMIDVKQRMMEYSVEELNESAEEYFRRLENWDYLFSKPLALLEEAPELLQCFAHVVQGAKLLPDMTVLDFGVGACWTSRYLTQLGMKVIAVDVSATALKIGEELYRRQPTIGSQPEPRFLSFNGRRLELPDESVDRITCWDAFHHVPNPADVLKEMARVLKPGGIAGFSEPGPTHSQAAQSQAEMRNYRVIENNVVIEEIWRDAQLAGFSDLKLALFNPVAHHCSLEQFQSFINGEDGELAPPMMASLRNYLRGRRLFFLRKGDVEEALDSRRREGLSASLEVSLEPARQRASAPALKAYARVENTGRGVWLGKSARVGAVHFGVHLYNAAGELITHGYYVHHGLRNDDPERVVRPGEVVDLVAEFPAPAAGNYLLEFDLVSGGVAWFSASGTSPVRLAISVD